MLYLNHKNIELPKGNNIYSTKEQKIRFILSIWNNYHFKTLLYKIYPEAKNYNTCDIFGGNVNLQLLGLHIQYAIAIIENPYIFCMNIYDSSLDDKFMPLYYRFEYIKYIKQIDYNGNYCKIIGCQNNNDLVIVRILLSETDHDFIPSHAEFNYRFLSASNFWNSNLIYSDDLDHFQLSNVNVLFIEDYQLSSYLNKQHIKPKLLYIYVNDLHIEPIIDFLIEHEYKFILLIRIKLIYNCNKFKTFLHKYNQILTILINSNTGEGTILDQLKSIIYDMYNIYVDSSLNVNLPIRFILNFRDFGLINNVDIDFVKMRKLKNLPVIDGDELYINNYEIL